MAGFRSSSVAMLRGFVLAAGFVVSLPSIAAVQLLLERDIDTSGQTDLFLVSYADQASFLSDTGFTQTALPQAIAGNFSVGGFTADSAGGVHLLLERDIDISGQTDLFLVSYADQMGFVNDTGFTQTALPQGISGNFSVGGFTVDAVGGWHLLLERDIDISGQTDLFLVSYADQMGFVNNTGFTQTALPQAIAGNFSVGGFTVDAVGGWHLLLERDIDISGQTDLFLVSYADQADFLNDTGFTQTALPQAIAGNFSVGGFHIDLPAPPSPPNGVPAPGSLPLLLLGVTLLFWFGLARKGESSPDYCGYPIGTRGLAM